MGCIEFGCEIYKESKKQNKGCCEFLGEGCNECCKGIGMILSEEKRNLYNFEEFFRFEQDDKYKKLYNNRDDNEELIKQMYEDNERLKVIMKDKMSKLLKERMKNKSIVMIGTGNSCNNDCYLYNLDLRYKCPKCEGKVEEDFENDYTVEQEWNNTRKVYKEVKHYNEKKICTGFRWNNNVSDCDVSLEGMFKYFDKKDPEKKNHYSLVVKDPTTKEKKTEEYDEEIHYMMLDGERFDFPLGLTMKQFFFINNEYFFPRNINVESMISYYGDNIDYSLITPFWYEGQSDRKEIGQSLGYYGYAWRHMVLIYTCNSCGYKYHIVKTSPFAIRDKSKDPQ